MRRATIFSGLTCSAVTVALVALVHGGGSERSASNSESTRGEVQDAQQTSSVYTELSESTLVARQRSGDEQDDSRNPTAPRKFSPGDEATTRQEVKEIATRYVLDVFPLLIEDFNLTSSQQDALLSLLIEAEIAATRTYYSSGEGMDALERSNRIAAIIGDQKLQQFLALERNREEYEEVAKVQSMLEQRDAPLTDTQLDGLLKIMVDVRDQIGRNLVAADVNPRSIEFLEHRLDQEDEYDRLIMELAPSVLSADQVEYLFELYQAQSYQRADALEFQKEAIAGDPTKADAVRWYPSRN